MALRSFGTAQPPRQIGFLLMDDFALMSAAAAIEPLRAANLLAGRPLYDPVFVSEAAGLVHASAGCAFHALAFDALPKGCDLVFVVAGGDPLSRPAPKTEAFLRALAARGVKLGGISGGAVLLARAGVLAGRRFTVHWEHFEGLRALSDSYLMERRLYVIDRDRYTCAGGAAPLDMMHALIASDHGSALARAVSDWFIHTGVRLADAPQQAGLAEKYQLHHPAMLSAIELMESHIADPLTVEQLAALAGLGPRQLQRLFESQLGLTVMRFYRDLRLEKAAQLLRQTALPVIEIALATGFSNPGHFSRAFREKFGHAPKEERKPALK